MMTNATETRLFNHMEQEYDQPMLQSEMQDIEHIMCADDIQLLDKAQAELRALYARLNIANSNVLTAIDARLAEFPPINP